MCRDGMAAVDERQKQAMKDLGWYAHYVTDDPDCPKNINYHTHGVSHSFNHPDFQICIGMPFETAHTIFNIAIAAVQEGKTFEPGKKYDNLIQSSKDGSNLEVLVLEAEENDRPVLRFIFPDKHNDFDGELAFQKEGCKE